MKAGKGKKGHDGRNHGRKAKVRQKFVEKMNQKASGAMKAPIQDTMPDGQSDSEDC